jgi:hypothetical protein
LSFVLHTTSQPIIISDICKTTPLYVPVACLCNSFFLSFFLSFFFFFFDTVYHYVAQTGFKLIILLPQPSEPWFCLFFFSSWFFFFFLLRLHFQEPPMFYVKGHCFQWLSELHGVIKFYLSTLHIYSP